MNIVCYLINQSPVYALDCETIKKVWNGRNTSYSYLRMFDHNAFAHVPKEQKSKLDMKCIECILLGYSHD